MPPRVRVTVDGRLALTVEQAAARYGVPESGMRTIIARAGTALISPANISGRMRLYYATDLDAVMKARPGKGANFRKAAGVG